MKILKFIFLLNVLIILGCSNSRQLDSEQVLVFKAYFNEEFSGTKYLSGGYVETIEIDKKEKVIRYANNKLYFDLSDCENEIWICISDGITNFAIKRNWNPKELSWVYDGVKYNVIRDSLDSGILVIGSTVIAGSDEKNKLNPMVNIFLYSLNDGILSFTTLEFDENLDTDIPLTFVRINK